MAAPKRRSVRPTTAAGQREYRIGFGKQQMRLVVGEYVIGRSAGCAVVLTDGLVSRRHALLRVRSDGAFIRDLGSSNGVYVNGTPIGDAEQRLEHNDRIRIGRESLVVTVEQLDSQSRRRTAPTLGGSEPLAATSPCATVGAGTAPPQSAGAAPASSDRRPPKSGGKATPPPYSEPSETRKMQAFEIVGPLADEAFANVQPQAAEKLLQRHLGVVLSGARSGVAIPDETRDAASRYALKLAVALRRSSWFDYVIELHTALRLVCSDAIIDQCETAIGRIPPVSTTALDAYLAVLRNASARFEADDLMRAHRLERLAREAAEK